MKPGWWWVKQNQMKPDGLPQAIWIRLFCPLQRVLEPATARVWTYRLYQNKVYWLQYKHQHLRLITK